MADFSDVMQGAQRLSGAEENVSNVTKQVTQWHSTLSIVFTSMKKKNQWSIELLHLERNLCSASRMRTIPRRKIPWYQWQVYAIIQSVMTPVSRFYQ